MANAVKRFVDESSTTVSSSRPNIEQSEQESSQGSNSQDDKNEDDDAIDDVSENGEEYAVEEENEIES